MILKSLETGSDKDGTSEFLDLAIKGPSPGFSTIDIEANDELAVGFQDAPHFDKRKIWAVDVIDH